MNSNKINKDHNDLNFTPMNIQDALTPINFPNPNMNGMPMNTEGMYMCFPTQSINMMNPSVNNNNLNLAPLTPYPPNIPDIENTNINPFNNNMNGGTNNSNINPNTTNTNIYNSGNTNLPNAINPNNATNTMPNPNTTNNNNFNNNSNINAPNNINPNNANNTIPNNTNMNNTNSFPNNSNALEYPSELNSDDLYSYNTPRLKDTYDKNFVNPLDVLRNFTLEDIELPDWCRNDSNVNDIDEIFKKIEENNSVVLATMKAYRIPYPIAKLLIKNIIKLTIQYKGR